MRLGIHFAAVLALAACTSQLTMPDIETHVDVLLLGEQHDAASHQTQHRHIVASLANRKALAALALEMAPQGRTTAGLAIDASESAVRTALEWNDAAWPWSAYGPSVMAAVRAGVPVVGANLPRERMRAAMSDTGVDASVPAPVLKAQRNAVRSGHCDLLPESQIAPMTRVQLARDRTMAQTVAAAARQGQTVVLLAGAAHVDAALGVPLHLPALLTVRVQRWPAEPTGKDYCAELRERLQKTPRP